LSGVVVKLTVAQSEKAQKETARVSGLVTRGGKPCAGGGRVSGWRKRPKEFDRVNAAIRRGRTVPAEGYEAVWARVASDGTYTIEGIEAGPGFGSWYFVYEEPGQPAAIAGPVKITNKDRLVKVDIAVSDGGSIEGKIENLPASLAGQVWVVAFDSGVMRAEVLAAEDGHFRFEKLPPGRYGLKAGHDAYEDPHVPTSQPGKSLDPSWWGKPAEPWVGAAAVTIEAGQAARGVKVDFRPPRPIPDNLQPADGKPPRSS
jgi:hypothetical protein